MDNAILIGKQSLFLQNAYLQNTAYATLYLTYAYFAVPCAYLAVYCTYLVVPRSYLAALCYLVVYSMTRYIGKGVLNSNLGCT